MDKQAAESIELLHRIVDLLSSKSDNHTFSISFNSKNEDGVNTAKFTQRFDTPIRLENDKYEIGLLSLNTYYTFPNLTSNINGKFRYSTDAGTNWNVLTLATGCYELVYINSKLQEMLGEAGRSISIITEPTQLKSKIKLSNDQFQIDFTYPNSINTLLGFEPQIIRGIGYHISEHVVNIQPISTINVNLDCIGSSYVEGKQSTSIFGFFPDVSPGHIINIDRQTPTYLPILTDTLSSITIWLTDQEGNLVNFRGEKITTTFYIRKK